METRKGVVCRGTAPTVVWSLSVANPLAGGKLLPFLTNVPHQGASQLLGDGAQTCPMPGTTTSPLWPVFSVPGLCSAPQWPVLWLERPVKGSASHWPPFVPQTSSSGSRAPELVPGRGGQSRGHCPGAWCPPEMSVRASGSGDGTLVEQPLAFISHVPLPPPRPPFPVGSWGFCVISLPRLFLMASGVSCRFVASDLLRVAVSM